MSGIMIGIVVGFALAGFMSRYIPGFNGFAFSPSPMSAGEGRIVAAIFLVGAAVIGFMPDKRADRSTAATGSGQ
jgi:hypothetical protein